MNNEKPVFELEEVSYSYLGRFPALCGITTQIIQGEKLAIIGSNGTGKSTLLSLLDGLIFPDSGKIRAFGRDLSEKEFRDEDFSREFRCSVGFVFQNPDVQLFCPTVKEDIIFGPLHLGFPREEVKKRLEKVVEVFDLGDLLERSPHQLSIGEKRKVSIASVLTIEPQVLLLDEPTAGLDPLTVRHIVDIILQENESGRTIITATHDMHIVGEIADCICCLGKERRIVRCGAAEELLADRVFLEQNNLIHMHAHRHKDKTHIHPHEHLDHHANEKIIPDQA
ncbi:MAG: ABC transporter ATP-binding protein [Candidatus Omnitrophica bacterium]|nr:ABC transporter ATP-binding protein [Candidatus Omnitrophota bacterium]